MDYERLLKRNRKKALIDPLALPEGYRVLDYNQEAIQKIIPHRAPFLLVDKLSALSLNENEETIIGSRYIDPTDAVFKGHFPEFPVYPGSLQLEMAGQLGLCLTHFVVNHSFEINDDTKPTPVRATKVLGAYFLEPLLPGKEATLIARRLEYDGYFGTVLSQVISEGKITCVSIAEVIFLDE